MSVPKKKAVVSKRVSDEQLKQSERWVAFTAASQIEWDDLSEEWKDFFEVIGDTSSTVEKMNCYIDIAIAEDEKK